MAITLTSTSGFSSLVHELILQQIEQNQRNSLVFASMEHNPINGRFVKGDSNVIRFPAYGDLADSDTPLTEGLAPTPVNLTIDSEAVSAAQFGTAIGISDLAEQENPHNLIAVATERLSRWASVRMDSIVRESFTAASWQAKYVTGAATSTLNSTNTLTNALMRQWAAYLDSQNVPRCADGTFHAILSPNLMLSLTNDSATNSLFDTFKYAEPAPLIDGYVRRAFGITFYVTNRVVVTTGSATTIPVHGGFLFGAGAFGVGDLQTVRSYYVPAGGDHSDPIGQQSIVGVKLALGALALTKAQGDAANAGRGIAFYAAAPTL